MDYFDFAFTLLMILFPAMFTLFVRRRANAPQTAAVAARLGRLLWLATGAAALAYLLLYRWQPGVAYFLWMLFFPLWFLLAMPLLRARDPGWGAPAQTRQRSASLVRRDLLPRRLRLAWIGLVVLWGMLLCASAAGLVLARDSAQHWWLLFFNLAAGLELALLHWAMRRSLIEPEAVQADEDEALRAERAGFHRFKLWAWFLLAALVMLVFSLPALLLTWFGNPALVWAIAIGAGGGTLAGIGGGVFGTLASIRRARINRLQASGRTTINH